MKVGIYTPKYWRPYKAKNKAESINFFVGRFGNLLTKRARQRLESIPKFTPKTQKAMLKALESLGRSLWQATAKGQEPLDQKAIKLTTMVKMAAATGILGLAIRPDKKGCLRIVNQDEVGVMTANAPNQTETTTHLALPVAAISLGAYREGANETATVAIEVAAPPQTGLALLHACGLSPTNEEVDSLGTAFDLALAKGKQKTFSLKNVLNDFFINLWHIEKNFYVKAAHNLSGLCFMGLVIPATMLIPQIASEFSSLTSYFLTTFPLSYIIGSTLPTFYTTFIAIKKTAPKALEAHRKNEQELLELTTNLANYLMQLSPRETAMLLLQAKSKQQKTLLTQMEQLDGGIEAASAIREAHANLPLIGEGSVAVAALPPHPVQAET